VAPSLGLGPESTPGIHQAKEATEAINGNLLQRSQNSNAAHMTMDDIAEKTGGEAYYNTNGFAWAIDRIVKQSDLYYTIAYTPSNNHADGRYRKIEVKLKDHSRFSYRVAYRRGYYADDAHGTQDARSNEDPLSPLMEPSMPNFSQIVFRMLMQRAALNHESDGATAGQNKELKGALDRYSASLAVSMGDMTFQQGRDGAAHGNFVFDLVAYNDQGHPVNWVSQRFQPVLTPDVLAAYRKNGLQLSEQLDLPKGSYYVRAGIYDLNSKKVGTLEFQLDTKGKARPTAN